MYTAIAMALCLATIAISIITYYICIGLKYLIIDTIEENMWRVDYVDADTIMLKRRGDE